MTNRGNDLAAIPIPHSTGRVVYFGKGGLACEQYFAGLGHPLPRAFNPADFLMDVISQDVRTPAAAEESKAMRCSR